MATSSYENIFNAYVAVYHWLTGPFLDKLSHASVITGDDWQPLHAANAMVHQEHFRVSREYLEFAEKILVGELYERDLAQFIEITNQKIQATKSGDQALAQALHQQMNEKYNQLVSNFRERLYELWAIWDKQPREVTTVQFPALTYVGGGLQVNSPAAKQATTSFVNTGEMNVTGSTINLGEISGSVTNTVNQLPPDSSSGEPSLKELLTELQAAIEHAAELAAGDRADLLEQVKLLAEAKMETDQAEKESLARKARKIFDATLVGLPATAKLVEVCSQALPQILKALGVGG